MQGNCLPLPYQAYQASKSIGLMKSSLSLETSGKHASYVIIQLLVQHVQ